MFSYDDRKKAVDLYFKYHNNGAAVIKELGYPSRSSLRQWVKEFSDEGELHKNIRENLNTQKKIEKTQLNIILNMENQLLKQYVLLDIRIDIHYLYG